MSVAARLYGVKVLDNSGSGSWASVVCGIDWCVENDREILSMSFGGSSMTDAAATAIEDAYAAGHLLVPTLGIPPPSGGGGCQATLIGTSMACPHVSGAAAVIWNGDNGDVRATLQGSAEAVLDTCEEGHGLLDVAAAVSAVSESG